MECRQKEINLLVLQNSYVTVLEEMQKKKVDLSNFGSIKTKSSVYTLVNLFLTCFKISLTKYVLIIKLKNGKVEKNNRILPKTYDQSLHHQNEEILK